MSDALRQRTPADREVEDVRTSSSSSAPAAKRKCGCFLIDFVLNLDAFGRTAAPDTTWCTGPRVALALHRALELGLLYAIINGLGATIYARMGWTLASPVAYDRQYILLAMMACTAARQAHWGLTYSGQVTWFIVSITFIYTVVNSLCLLVALSHSSAVFVGASLVKDAIAVALFLVGSFLEYYSEQQRIEFKKDPANRGKIFMGGLFRYARHINYTGHLLYEVGQGLFAGSVALAIGLWVFHHLDFGLRSIPLLHAYMASHYGPQYTTYCRQTPYKLIPGIVGL